MTYGLQSIGGNAIADQSLLYGIRAPFGKPQVVFSSTYRVRMAGDQDSPVRILLKHHGYVSHKLRRLGAELSAIEIEQEPIHVVGPQRFKRVSHLGLQTETGYNPRYPICSGPLLPAEVERRFNQNWIVYVVGDDKLPGAGTVARGAIDTRLNGWNVGNSILDDNRNPHIDRSRR